MISDEMNNPENRGKIEMDARTVISKKKTKTRHSPFNLIIYLFPSHQVLMKNQQGAQTENNRFGKVEESFRNENNEFATGAEQTQQVNPSINICAHLNICLI